MNLLVEKYNLIEDAKVGANSAKDALVKLMAHDNNLLLPLNLNTALSSITAFANSMTELSFLLSRKIEEQRSRWNNSPILEAVIRCGSDSRKIVVAKPNDRIDEPFVSESFYNAIKTKWNGTITTDEDYDIVVINRKGREIGRISK